MTDSNATLLCRAGVALYGEQWQAPLARLLSVSLRRVQYYAAEARQPPDSMLLEVAGHLRGRAAECHALALILSERAQDSKP
jgi:hypothetical protein